MDKAKLLSLVAEGRSVLDRLDTEINTADPAPAPAPTPTPIPAPTPIPVPPPPTPSRMGIGYDPTTDRTLFPQPRRTVYLTAGAASGDGSTTKPFGTLDQVLIARRGDPTIDLVRVSGVIPATTTNWDVSGASPQQPLIFEGASAAAKLSSFRVEAGPANNLVFKKLQLGSSRFNTPSTGLLFEDVLISKNIGDGSDVQGARPVSLAAKRWKNVTWRFCRVLDNFNRNGQAQGLFIIEADDWLIEYSIFDGNGWDATMARALSDPIGGEQIRSHNVYAAMPGGPGVVRNNLFSRPASHGIHFRTGGQLIDNLFLRCPIAWQFGFHYPSDGGKPDWGVATGIVSGNIALGADDIRDNPRGVFGIIEHTDGLQVVNNAAVRNLTPATNNLWSWYGNSTLNNIRLDDNYGFNWSAAPFHRNPPASLVQRGNQFGLAEADIQNPGTIDFHMSPQWLTGIRSTGFRTAAEARKLMSDIWAALGV